MNGDVRILTRADVAELLPLGECITAVESAFRLHGEGQSLGPGVLSVHAHGGAFHTKAAGLGPYFAVKTNGNFFGNPQRGLPRIQGTVVLCDAGDGSPLAILDSIEITIRRTGAATAVAAKHLSRRDSRTVGIIGCGNQGRVSIRALMEVRTIERVYAFDENEETARAFVADLTRESGVEATVVSTLADAIVQSDICVTSTPARNAFFRREHLHPGLFVAAVGADNSEKQEIDPLALAASRVFVDQLEQAATIGDLHHAIAAGIMSEGDVVAELSDVVTGRNPGRRSDAEIIVFDSTGTALQDVAAAAIVYERSIATGRGLVVRLGGMSDFDRLLRFPRLVSEILSAAPTSLLRTRPAEGGFALVEQACHLADLEQDGFAMRIDRLLSDARPILPNFDGERVAVERNYIEQNAFDSVARFIALRERNVKRLRSLSEADWNRSGEQEGVGEVTLRRVFERMGDHDASHACELVGLLGELGLAIPAELREYERPLQETA